MAMSTEHKAALAEGRRQSRVIKAYLSALESRRPGRPVTAESLEQRLASLTEKIEAEDDPLRRVDLVQARIDAEKALATVGQRVDFNELEDGFVEVAKSYSERKGITYTAWREANVPAEVLKKAGIPRTRRG